MSYSRPEGPRDDFEYVPQPPREQKRRSWLPWVAGTAAFVVGTLVGVAAMLDTPSETNSKAGPTATKKIPARTETAKAPGARRTAPRATQSIPTVTRTAPERTVTRTVSGPTVTRTVPTRAAPAASSPSAAAITQDGIYLVGSEVRPGTYRSRDEGTLCYWARLSSSTGDPNKIITNGLGANQTVTITASDKAFQTRDCGTWTRIR